MTIQLQLFTDTELHKRNRWHVKRFLAWRKRLDEEPEEQETEEDDFMDSDVINSLAEKFEITTKNMVFNNMQKYAVVSKVDIKQGGANSKNKDK